MNEQFHHNPEHHEFLLPVGEAVPRLPDEAHAEALRPGENPLHSVGEIRNNIAELTPDNTRQELAASLQAAEGAAKQTPSSTIVSHDLQSITRYKKSAHYST